MDLKVSDRASDIFDTTTGTEDQVVQKPVDIDARRRLEDKLEDMRLRREVQEFDFDVYGTPEK